MVSASIRSSTTSSPRSRFLKTSDPAADGDPSQAEGFLLLDKPEGMTSFQALRPVKHLFRGRKVGHAGTLDPAASGLLLVGVGGGTRLLEHLEGMTKTYSFLVRFGLTSDSYDLEGEVAPADEAGRRKARALTAADVEKALGNFRGTVTQKPPVFSALKIDGKRACDRARAGESVELAAREVTVHSLELTAFGLEATGPVAALRTVCSKGTYVRSLAHDLGQALGCGAVADKIRRLAIGPFRVEEAAAPEALTVEALRPLDIAVAHLPAARLAAERVEALLQGRSTSPAGYVVEAPQGAAPPAAASPRPAAAPGTYRVLDPEGRFLALAEIDAEGRLLPKKVLARA